ncbi:Hypothetical protein, putative [Bodo saltans]|uniref:RNA-binding protein n=1 Tax=Bodo saltans TaxID=75058 RepID=A0A0S4JFT9_BODSA|nr:Hypothetical protein, putative [Bodo saltans]|eukprot:CUG88895.1 Hypothetical protein, putative [Bodo saltans]
MCNLPNDIHLFVNVVYFNNSHREAMPTMSLNKRFATDAGAPTSSLCSTKVAARETLASPLTATSVLRDADARERTVAIHGVVPNSIDALVEEMRNCGHITRVVRSKRCSTTLFVTFGSTLAAKAAVELQANAIVDGQRFAVTFGALPEDEEVDDENYTTATTKTTTLTSSSSPTFATRATELPTAAKVSRPLPPIAAVSAKFQKVKFSFLTCLPLADRWLLPLLVSSGSNDSSSRKRGREE